MKKKQANQILGIHDVSAMQKQNLGQLYDLLCRSNAECFAITRKEYDSRHSVHRHRLQGTIQRSVLLQILRCRSLWSAFEEEMDPIEVGEQLTAVDGEVSVGDIQLTPTERELFVNLDEYLNPSPFLVNGKFDDATQDITDSMMV